MVLMLLQITIDVLGKYLFTMPVPGTLEVVSSYYMAALVFLPLGLVTRHCDHIKVDLFTRWMSPRSISLFDAFANLLAAVYVFFLTWKGVGEALHMTAIREVWETELWHLQVWPSRWFVPIGCGLMFIYFVIHAIDDAAYAIRGRRITSVVADTRSSEVEAILSAETLDQGRAAK